MQLLNSSCIRWADYDSWSGTLTIQFTSGRRYSHAGVPESIYWGLLSASSPGRYYNLYIKGIY